MPARHRAPTSRPLQRRLQPRRPLESEGDVEAFDPLAGGALDQVVKRRGDDSLLALGGDIDQAQVRVARQLRGGADRYDPRERMAGVELPVRLFELGR